MSKLTRTKRTIIWLRRAVKIVSLFPASMLYIKQLISSDNDSIHRSPVRARYQCPITLKNSKEKGNERKTRRDYSSERGKYEYVTCSGVKVSIELHGQNFKRFAHMSNINLNSQFFACFLSRPQAMGNRKVNYNF